MSHRGFESHPLRHRDVSGQAGHFAKSLEAKGGKVIGQYWLMGQYDTVGIYEAPDDETMTRAVLELCALGNVRTATSRAFSADEFARIVGS